MAHGKRTIVLIAMKGYPCTGKSTLARSIAKAFKCPLINHETVFNCMANAQESPSATLEVAAIAEYLNDLSFEPVCQMALTQLRSNFPVVTDTSLSQPHHLNRLLQVSKSAGTRLIIIECKALSTYEWRIRLERRQGVSNGIIRWYKPSTWDDLEGFMERYDWCANCDVDGGVSKLEVDSTGCSKDGEFVIVNHHLNAASKHTHLVNIFHWIGKESLRPLDTEDQEGEVDQVEGTSKNLRDVVKRIGHPSSHVHVLNLSSEEEKIDGKITCRKCLELVTGPVYNCTDCDLSLHKSCAELTHKMEILPHQINPLVDPTTGKYSFPEKDSCPFHVDANMGFLDDCMDCLFHTILRCGLFPMVLDKKFHDTPLSLGIFPIVADTFMCIACGKTSNYTAFYFCRHCRIELHIGCALLPFSFKHEIHRHPLHLTFLRDDDGSAEFYCDVCEEYRNPNHMI